MNYLNLSALELARIAPLDEAARLSSLSKDTIRRKHREKLIELSERRLGMRVGDALQLGEAAARPRKTAANRPQK